MLNVLLVDDEKLERVLIRKGYNWEENGFNIVGEAASGEDALEYINYHNVDIVITDIKMPVMTGIEFMQECRDRGYDTVFILLTNLEEFSLAKSALSL